MKFIILFPIFLLLILSGCQTSSKKDIADIIYFGGPILTMEDDNPEVEAIAVKDGKILFSGTKAAADQYTGENTTLHDLNGKTLLPGFIDAHGHLASRAGMMQAIDLSPTPYGTVNSIPDLQKTLKEYIEKKPYSESAYNG
ncbi:hypothetical protein HMPREF0765_1306 [Sphingobacterium spiritivorum ATCC 33300]|uniref:Amidohydrolase 3 domain-containing protein n=1 Tax=Sphingobacterium spiritivorum ATCC 33300 TaxID=525372 RepID=C2FVF0_SPHSI|nr:amidohydrolase family protein [Sphingobacterium spiritivorum]EEI93008.1 hypothetical protein HMPREF0765_1306 [Sphingobacterium spiritivorum ATCC 33300]